MEKGLASNLCVLFSSLGWLYIRYSDPSTVSYRPYGVGGLSADT